jgi:hypothetical protein
MKDLKLILILVLFCCSCYAQDLSKQARDEAGKALKEKKIDAEAYAGLLAKINNGKAADVLKELNNPDAPKASAYSDWPRWLGPNRDGSSPEKGLLREWPADGPKLLWSKPLGDAGQGWGTPCVSEGQVFINSSSNQENKAENYISCYDAFSGSLAWQTAYPIGRPMQFMGWGWTPRGTITATKKYLYTLDDQGLLGCFEKKSGHKVWITDLDEMYHPYHDDWKGWCASRSEEVV